MTRRLLVLPLVAIVLAVTGCGADEPEVDPQEAVATVVAIECQPRGMPLGEALEIAGYKDPIADTDGTVSFKKSFSDLVTVDQNGKGTNDRSRKILDALGCR